MLQPLAFPPYSALQRRGLELTERDGEDDDTLDDETAGEDRMGVVNGQGWEMDAGDKDEQEELGWLAEDDIEDWED